MEKEDLGCMIIIMLSFIALIVGFRWLVVYGNEQTKKNEAEFDAKLTDCVNRSMDVAWCTEIINRY